MITTRADRMKQRIDEAILQAPQPKATATEEPPRRRGRRPKNPTQQPLPRPGTNPFIVARNAAAVRLETANCEQAEATQKLAALALEIPRLEQVIRALDFVIDPQPNTLARLLDPERPKRLLEDVDEFAGMASLPASTHTPAGQELAPDIDTLPGVGGGGFV